MNFKQLLKRLTKKTLAGEVRWAHEQRWAICQVGDYMLRFLHSPGGERSSEYAYLIVRRLNSIGLCSSISREWHQGDKELKRTRELKEAIRTVGLGKECPPAEQAFSELEAALSQPQGGVV